MDAGGRSLRPRLSSAAGAPNKNRYSTVIVKVIGKGIRSVHDVRRVVRYMARLDNSDREPYSPGEYIPVGERLAERGLAADPEPIVHDEAGQALDREEIMARLQEWQLMADSENLSADARKLQSANQSSLDLPAQKRLKNVQAWHIVMSVPCEKRSDIIALEQSVSNVVHEQFAEQGHPALWALHVEHGAQVHAHVVVGSKPLNGGLRLRFDKGGIRVDEIRQQLADEATALGLKVQATRRADRPEYLEALVEGLAVEVPKQSWITAKRSGISRIASDAPDWLVMHGPAYLERRKKKAARRLAGEKAYPEVKQPVPGETERGGIGMLARLLGRRRQPASNIADEAESLEGYIKELGVFRTEAGEDRTQQAIQRFRQLQDRSKVLARWYLFRHPVLYDDVTGNHLVMRRSEVRERIISLLDGEAIISPQKPPMPVRIDKRALQPPSIEAQVARIVEMVEAFNSLEKLARRAEKSYPLDVEAERMVGIVRRRAADLLDGNLKPPPPSGGPVNSSQPEVRQPGRTRGRGDMGR